MECDNRTASVINVNAAYDSQRVATSEVNVFMKLQPDSKVVGVDSRYG